MHRGLTRAGLLSALAALCALTAPAFSAAATKYDTSYQNGGTLLLPAIRGVYGQVAHKCEVSGKNLHIAGRFGRNVGGVTSWRRHQSLAVTAVRIDPRQPMTLGVADVRWKKQRIPTNHIVADSDFDQAGGFAYVTRPVKSDAKVKLKLFRVDSSGNRIKTFGRNGYVTVTVARPSKRQSYGVQVIALPKNKVFVATLTAQRLAVTRFTARGKLDATWGSGGIVELLQPRGSLIAAIDGGGLLVTASGIPVAPMTGLTGILKLSASGETVTGWGDNGFWRPPAPADASGYESSSTLLAMTQRNGDYAILHGDRASNELGYSTDLRLSYVDEETGVTTHTNSALRNYSVGGDGGIPDAEPWTLAPSSAGAVFARAESFYDRTGGTFRGHGMRFSSTTAKTLKDVALSSPGFATGAFAVDPSSRYLYFCGAFGVTSIKAKDPNKREQRKNVAIRRVAL